MSEEAIKIILFSNMQTNKPRATEWMRIKWTDDFTHCDKHPDWTNPSLKAAPLSRYHQQLVHRLIRQKLFTVTLSCSIHNLHFILRQNVMQGPGVGLHAHTYTHTHTTQPAWYFLDSIRLFAPTKSRASVWSAARHQEQWSTSVHIKQQNRKEKTIKHIIAAHVELHPGRTDTAEPPDCGLWASLRKSQVGDKLCCQIQQLGSEHHDADRGNVWASSVNTAPAPKTLPFFSFLIDGQAKQSDMSTTLRVCRLVYF